MLDERAVEVQILLRYCKPGQTFHKDNDGLYPSEVGTTVHYEYFGDTPESQAQYGTYRKELPSSLTRPSNKLCRRNPG